MLTKKVKDNFLPTYSFKNFSFFKKSKLFKANPLVRVKKGEEVEFNGCMTLLSAGIRRLHQGVASGKVGDRGIPPFPILSA